MAQRLTVKAKVGRAAAKRKAASSKRSKRAQGRIAPAEPGSRAEAAASARIMHAAAVDNVVMWARIRAKALGLDAVQRSKFFDACARALESAQV